MEEKLVEKFAECRKTRKSMGIFVGDLLSNGFNIDALVKCAFEKGQNLPLGFVCEAVYEAMPEKYAKAKKRLCELTEKLYEVPKTWQYLYENLEDFVKSIVASDISQINRRWKIYSQYSAAQAASDIKGSLSGLQ